MIPTRIGQRFEGGYFAGIIRVVSTCYAIIVDPKSLQDQLKVKTTVSETLNTQSVNHGWANTAAMNDTSHPAAQYCRSLTAGGYTDRYLPSRDELELCYRYLKPGTTDNTTSNPQFGGNQNTQPGTNLNSIPVGTPYTTTNPAQTTVIAFRTSSVESFDECRFWTSTESSASTYHSLSQNFSNGGQVWAFKTYACRVRAVRRVEIYSKETK